MNNPLRTSAIILCAVLLAAEFATAAPAMFRIEATITRPRITVPDSFVIPPGSTLSPDSLTRQDCWTTVDCVRSRAPNPNNWFIWVPARYQLVQIYQPGAFHPIYCGSAYTDSAGRLSGQFFCGNNLPDRLYLEIRGESLMGFRVGSNSPYPWEYLEVAYAYTWVTPMRPYAPVSGVMDMGVIPLGHSPGNPATIFQTSMDFRAAAMVERVDFAYEQLNLGFVELNPQLPPRPLYTRWIVNDEIFDATDLNAPYTYWNTIHMPERIDGSEAVAAGYVLGAVPHELGHAIYNSSHSNIEHYFGEVARYMNNHSACEKHGFAFAAYEGYANTISNLVWRHHAEAVGDLDFYPNPTNLCTSDRGIEREGNVTEFYTRAFADIPMTRPPGSLQTWTLQRIGANQYAFPSTNAFIDMVINAGMNGEDIRTMWNASLANICSRQYQGVGAYCGSRRFRCHVKNEIASVSDANATDIMPDFFNNVSCGWSSPRIKGSQVRPINPSNRTVDLNFAAAELADSYRVRARRPNGSNSFQQVALGGQNLNESLQASITIPKCGHSRLTVETRFDSQSKEGPERVIGADPSCPGNNLAFKKKARQSSVAYRRGAGRAVDGNTSGDWSQGSVTHTQNERNPWWEVDLGTPYRITKVEVWNRTDCCVRRLNGFTVIVSDQPQGRGQNYSQTPQQVTLGSSNLYTFTGNASGRFVRVRLNGTNILSLAEVRVEGQPTNR